MKNEIAKKLHRKFHRMIIEYNKEKMEQNLHIYIYIVASKRLVNKKLAQAQFFGTDQNRVDNLLPVGFPDPGP